MLAGVVGLIAALAAQLPAADVGHSLTEPLTGGFVFWGG
nr:MAG TPA: hypothetical protein [Caudoviricetes sp.]